MYVSVNTKLYRRNDGTLAHATARWVLVDQEPPVGAFNSGLRGLTCVSHDGSPSLLLSTEGTGNVYRLDHLPQGQLDGPVSGKPGQSLTPVLEFSPFSAIRQMLAAHSAVVPATGRGSVNYVIAACNNFETVSIGGVTRQLFGIEWGYDQACPPTRICAPSGFDAAACFGARTDQAGPPSYALRCLSGPQFQPSRKQPSPVRPDGHRVEVYTSDYFTGDPDHPVLRWDVHDPRRRDFWGHEVIPSWYTEATTILDLDGNPQPAAQVEAAEVHAATVTVGADGFSVTR